LKKCKHCFYFKLESHQPYDGCVQDGYFTFINGELEACATFRKAQNIQINLKKFLK